MWAKRSFSARRRGRSRCCDPVTSEQLTRRRATPAASARWQPLRLGLVELFHYDSEEFWFRDGHLLLRGNNGTGKSKVLSLTLPFLLDAQLKPSRVEPDGDRQADGVELLWGATTAHRLRLDRVRPSR